MAGTEFTQELFGDLPPADLATQVDAYVAAMEKSASTANGQIAFDMRERTLTKVDSPQVLLEKAYGTLTPEQTAALESAGLTKDLSPTSPLSTGYVAYDLEVPALMLAPRPTPLRNRIPRTKGVGKAYQFKRITGFSGTGTGGVGAVNPGFTDPTQTNFANPGSANALYYNRPRKISYAGDEMVLPYVQNGLSDELSWWTQFSALGFQDMRALSRSSTLYASMLAEEREILYGRGTSTGFSGVLAAPTGTPTGAARSAAAGETGISGATTSIYVKIVPANGDFGVGQAGSASAAIAVTNGQVVDVTIPAAVAGATHYLAFVSTGASDPGDASRWLYAGPAFPNGKSPGRTSGLTLTIQGALPTSGQSIAAFTALDQSVVNLASADGQSARADNYDGILPWLMRFGGYNKSIESVFSTSNPGAEYQDAFAALYDSVKADPEQILLHGGDRKQLSDTLKGQSSSNYRLTVTETGNVRLGDVVTAIQNEITGRVVDMEVHPWMPQGISPILTNNLPLPDSNVGNVWEMRLVQDYMAIDWPVTQMSYDTSVWWAGALICRAPAWSGVIRGIRPA